MEAFWQGAPTLSPTFSSALYPSHCVSSQVRAAGVSPEAFGGPCGEAESGRGFLHGHTDEVAQLDQFCRRRVFTRESVQSFVDREQFVRWGGQDQRRFVQFLVGHAAAALLALFAPG